MTTLPMDKVTWWKKKYGCGVELQQLVDVINDANSINLPTQTLTRDT